MEYKFNQAVSIDGQRFAVGVNEVSEKHELHPHFLRYVEIGWVEEVQEKAAKLVNVEERNKKLYEKLVKRAAKAEPEPEEQDEQESDLEEEDEPTTRSRARRRGGRNSKPVEEQEGESED